MTFMTLQEVVTRAAVEQPTHSHTVIALWVVVALAVAEAFALAVMLRARGGWGYLATIPMTNLRSLAAIVLFVVSIIGTGIVGYLSGVWPPEAIYDTTMYVLTIWAGIEVAGVWIKRATTDATIPSTQNMMAAQAASGVPVDARDARVAAAPQARQPVPGEAPIAPVVPPNIMPNVSPNGAPTLSPNPSERGDD